MHVATGPLIVAGGMNAPHEVFEQYIGFRVVNSMTSV